MGVLALRIPWRGIAFLLASVALASTTPIMAEQDSPGRKHDPKVAVGRKGPIALRLRLRNLRIKRGEKVGFQLQLKNVSRKKIFVADNVFHDPEMLGKNSSHKDALHFVVELPDGSTMKSIPPGKPFPESCTKIVMVSTLPAMTEEEAKALDKRDEEDARVDMLMKENTFSFLPPGKALDTPPWVRPRIEGCEEVPVPAPDEFTQLWNYEFREVGRHRIKCVNAELSPRQQAILGRKPKPDDVMVETDWLDLTVE